MQKLVKNSKKICEDSQVLLDSIYLLLLYSSIYYLDHYNMCLRLTLQVITTRAVVKTISMRVGLANRLPQKDKW